MLFPLAGATLVQAQEAQADAAGEVPKISPADAQKVMQQLKELREKRDQMRMNQLQAGVKRINEALGSETKAVELYMDCVQSQQFRGQESSMNSDFRAWKEKNKDLMKDDNFRKALGAHLRYLAISLEYLAIQDKEPLQIVPKLVSYINSDLEIQIPDRGPVKDLMDGDLKQSVFVQTLGLDADIGRLKNWASKAKDVNAIEEQTILPILREHAKEQVLPFWDQKIQRETAASEKHRLASRVEDFRNVRLPTLHWRKSEDMIKLGQGQAGYQQMFSLISAHPAHPDFPNWVSTLEGYLKASLPAPATPTPAAQADQSAPAPAPAAPSVATGS